eukprot:1148196-Pelagomonas_calceolata.AAC.2
MLLAARISKQSNATLLLQGPQASAGGQQRAALCRQGSGVQWRCALPTRVRHTVERCALPARTRRSMEMCLAYKSQAHNEEVCPACKDQVYNGEVCLAKGPGVKWRDAPCKDQANIGNGLNLQMTQHEGQQPHWP